LVVGGHAAPLAAIVAALIVVGLTTAAAQPAPPPPPRQAAAKSRLPKGATAGDRAELPYYPLQPQWTDAPSLPPAAPPVVTGTRLIAPYSNGDVYFFELSTGAHLFSRPYRTTMAPAVAGTRVLIAGDATLDALDVVSGTAQWQTPLPAPLVFAPLVRSGWAFLTLKNGSIVALRSENGAQVWTATPGGAVGAPLIAEGDRLFAATGSVVQALAVADGQAVWKATLDSDVTAVAAVEGHVFAATAGRWLVAIDARKGEIRWRYRIGGSAIGLAVDEDRVIAVMLDQSVRAFKIGSGAQVWRQELSFRPTAGPIVAGRSVLVTGFAPTLRVLDRRTGANLGHYDVPLPDGGPLTLETLSSAPLVSPGATPFQDLVIFSTQHGWIHAARRTFDQLATPVTTWPGTAAPLPAPPPGWVAPAEAPPPAPAPTGATPAPAAGPPGTPPRTPPAPPAR
jgi:outer membrane protein assembly factor BamB